VDAVVGALDGLPLGDEAVVDVDVGGEGGGDLDGAPVLVCLKTGVLEQDGDAAGVGG
jgi:hypothetical protein